MPNQTVRHDVGVALDKRCIVFVIRLTLLRDNNIYIYFLIICIKRNWSVNVSLAFAVSHV